MEILGLSFVAILHSLSSRDLVISDSTPKRVKELSLHRTKLSEISVFHFGLSNPMVEMLILFLP